MISQGKYERVHFEKDFTNNSENASANMRSQGMYKRADFENDSQMIPKVYQ